MQFVQNINKSKRSRTIKMINYQRSKHIP